MKQLRNTIDSHSQIVLLLVCCVCFCQCDKKPQSIANAEWVPLVTEIPLVSFGYHIPLPKLPVPIEPAPSGMPSILVPRGTRNLALGCNVQCSENALIGSPSLLTDGIKTQNEGLYLQLYQSNPAWVQVDLGQRSKIYVIWFWHMWSGRATPLVYHDVVVQVSDDPSFESGVATVFNNDFDDSLGFGRGRDLPYQEIEFGKAVRCDGIDGRYVRIFTNGRYNTGGSPNTISDFVEVEVHGLAQRIQTNK